MNVLSDTDLLAKTDENAATTGLPIEVSHISVAN